jgi:hypothetical protein
VDDYREHFTVGIPAGRTPEQWAHRILSEAPLRQRATMVGAWIALGVLLTPPYVPGAVLGWRIRRVEPDRIELGIHSLTGLTARLTWRIDGDQLDHVMVVHFATPLSARIWARVAPGHRRFIQARLAQAARETPVPA